MTRSPVDPYDALHCQHAGGDIKVAISPNTGSWSAVCPRCGDRWLRTGKDIPAVVMLAVYQAAGITTLTSEQAHGLGLYAAGVGDLYLPPSPLIQGLRWIITPEGVECGVYHDQITGQILDGFHQERTEFALVSGDHALILAARFGRVIDWWDGSWQAALQHGHLPVGIAEPQPDMHLPVKLILVDSATGAIAGMRIVTWPYRFHQAVYKAILVQLELPSSIEAGMREVQTWIDRYTDPVELVTRRAEVMCRGGASTAFAR